MSMTQDQPHHAPASRMESAQTAQALCDRLMEYTGEMITVLERETTLLRSGRPHEIAALNARKTALSTTLTQDMSVFRRDAEFIKSAVPDRIEAIREQHMALQKSLNANHDALSAIKAISESMLQTVAAKVGEATSGPEVYGKNASMAARHSGGSSISLDETL